MKATQTNTEDNERDPEKRLWRTKEATRTNSGTRVQHQRAHCDAALGHVSCAYFSVRPKHLEEDKQRGGRLVHAGKAKSPGELINWPTMTLPRARCLTERLKDQI